MKDRYIEINLTKCTLFLTQAEMQKLLNNEPAIWSEALKRGKYILRSRKQREREQAKALEESK